MKSNFSWLDKMILRLTCRVWNRLISRQLCRHYNYGVINSRQLHILTADFDPTQKAVYYHL